MYMYNMKTKTMKGGGGGTGYVDIYLLPFVPVVFENNCRKLLSR